MSFVHQPLDSLSGWNDPGEFPFGSPPAAAVVTGTSTGPVSRSLTWGRAGYDAFVVRDGILTSLAGLPNFASGETITDVFESETELFVLGDNNGAPFAWIADHTLQNSSRIELADIDASAGPRGEYSNLRARQIVERRVLVERTLDDESSTTWLADLSAGTLTYLFSGTPTDFSVGRLNNITVVTVLGQTSAGGAISPAGIMWRNGVLANLAGVPIAISPSGNIGIAERIVDSQPQLVLLGFGAGFELQRPLPVLPGGSQFVAAGVNNFGEVAGTYVTEGEQQSGFYYVYRSDTMYDVRADNVFGSPGAYESLNVDQIFGPTSAGDVLIRQDDDFSLLSITNGGPEGPFRVGEDASLAVGFTPLGGIYVVTTNGAQEVVSLTGNATAAGPWSRVDFNERDVYSDAFSGDLITWVESGPGTSSSRVIALPRPDGLYLLTETTVGNSTVWTSRNLTAEIPGAEPIVDGLITLLPHSGYRLVGGLTAEGELVIYGQTRETVSGAPQWLYNNLYHSVVQPSGAPAPDFRAATPTPQLVGYVTQWDGQNIAGIAADGEIVVFWTAPGVTGWRLTNLAESTVGTPSAAANFSSLSVALTPWNGINLYGESSLDNRIQVIWWVPQFQGRWQADVLIPESDAAYPRGTLTAYAQPWGGLNIARVNPEGQIEVFWWSPASNEWRPQALNDATNSYLAPFAATGRLMSAVSPSGATSLFARNELGDLFRFFWSPGASWELERI